MNGIFAILLMVIVGSGNPLRPCPIANNNLHLEKDISAGYQKMSCVKEFLCINPSSKIHSTPLVGTCFEK
jgi:hypothetical protein